MFYWLPFAEVTRLCICITELLGYTTHYLQLSPLSFPALGSNPAVDLFKYLIVQKLLRNM